MYNHLVRKRTLNHLTKCVSVSLRTKWLWVRIWLLSLETFFFPYERSLHKRYLSHFRRANLYFHPNEIGVHLCEDFFCRIDYLH